MITFYGAPPPRLIEIDVSELLSVSVTYDVVVRLDFGRPGCGEAARRAQFSATEKPENAPAYCGRSGSGKSLATASSAMKTKTPIAT